MLSFGPWWICDMFCAPCMVTGVCQFASGGILRPLRQLPLWCWLPCAGVGGLHSKPGFDDPPTQNPSSPGHWPAVGWAYCYFSAWALFFVCCWTPMVGMVTVIGRLLYLCCNGTLAIGGGVCLQAVRYILVAADLFWPLDGMHPRSYTAYG